MKNWLLALSGLCARAIETAPRLCGSAENSALMFGQVGAVIAGAGRVAALGHEAGDHAVEGNVVIKAAVGELGDPLDVAGRKVGPELDDDIAAG